MTFLRVWLDDMVTMPRIILVVLGGDVIVECDFCFVDEQPTYVYTHH